MKDWVNALTTKPDALNLSINPSGWKERINFTV